MRESGARAPSDGESASDDESFERRREFLVIIEHNRNLAYDWLDLTSVIIEHEFLVPNGLMSIAGITVVKNYLDVYRFESWGGSVIPTYVVGQQFTPTMPTLDAGVTRPPPALSEADLLSCMDKAGIGTDATMHDHIKKLLDRFYATKDANMRFLPTSLGEALVMGYDDMGVQGATALRCLGTGTGLTWP